MTPQERQMVDELFDRLASLENNPRDPTAVQAINDGLQRAPNAIYALVQTTLLQDEALKRANARIQELEKELGVQPGEPVQQAGFLDNMRDALFGRPGAQGSGHGSVPSVRQGTGGSVWGSGAAAQPAGAPYQQSPYQQPMAQQPGAGGSFLGTAAATAAGVIGGALLMNSIRGLFPGQHQGQAFGDTGSGAGGGAPWGPNASGSDLAREAGLDDIGRGGRTAAYDDNGGQRAGLFDVAQNDADYDNDDSDFDVGGDGGSDTA